MESKKTFNSYTLNDQVTIISVIKEERRARCSSTTGRASLCVTEGRPPQSVTAKLRSEG